MSLSEIEIRTPYVVAERLIVALMLRFKPAKNVLSDTLVCFPLIRPSCGLDVRALNPEGSCAWLLQSSR
jgi:hypothetical protein